jgi:4-hydroxybenzoate polyprenyltransferase
MAKATADRERTLAAELPVAPAGALAQARLVIQAMRPREWTKNLLLFAGVFFAGHLLQGAALARAVIAAAAFCAASGAIYLFNDLLDIRCDRLHPTKRFRPLASGALSKNAAVAGMLAATALAFVLAALLARLPLGGTPAALAARLWPPTLTLRPLAHAVPATRDPYSTVGGSAVLFALSLVAYFALQIAYSLRLKHIVLLDVFAIAAGFVLRALAGAVAVAVPISPWLYLCTILLSLFLGLSKRRQEVVLLEEGAVAHRQILQEYSLPLLDQLITVVTSATIIAYSLYTFQSETAGDRRLMVTIPFAIYGIFRYLYLVQQKRMGGNPAEVLLRDRHIQVVVAGWIAIALFVLYVVPR